MKSPCDFCQPNVERVYSNCNYLLSHNTTKLTLQQYSTKLLAALQPIIFNPKQQIPNSNVKLATS